MVPRNAFALRGPDTSDTLLASRDSITTAHFGHEYENEAAFALPRVREVLTPSDNLQNRQVGEPWRFRNSPRPTVLDQAESRPTLRVVSGAGRVVGYSKRRTDA